MNADIFKHKETRFVLWLPARTSDPPSLVIGTFRFGNPPSVINAQTFVLTETKPGLWEIDASKCNLTNGQVYHYWFEVTDDCPWHKGERLRCTDPFATAVDWRVCADVPDGYDDNDRDPAAVILYDNGRLFACDHGGEQILWGNDLSLQLSDLSVNCATVIYEIPCRWAQSDASRVMDVGTFQDVRALVDQDAPSPNFPGVRLLNKGYALIADLGVNAVELLPPADSWQDREWGYGTSNFLSPDFDLSMPKGFSWAVPNTSFAALVESCHKKKIRVFVDVVCSFGQRDSYMNINDTDLHTPMAQFNPGESEYDVWKRVDDELRSSRTGEVRKDWGGRLFRYIRVRQGIYDPVSGTTADIVPARQFMKVYIERWINDLHVDGVRMDSLETVASWDFIREFKDHARAEWKKRWQNDAGADARFLVAGEELWVPLDLIKPTDPANPDTKRVDALWNEKFKERVRKAVLGVNMGGDNTFENTVRRMIDCRNTGFPDGAAAINYVTSHDVGGYGNERLYDYLEHCGIVLKEERCKLAFVCLLTSVGIPMMLAGEEFADKCDLSTDHPYKQLDTINYDRLQYAFDQRAGKAPIGNSDFRWRARLFDCVKRLVALRTTHPALRVNDTEFIHIDFNEGKRVLAWTRGAKGSSQVVVVANFSDWGQPLGSEYIVNNWPHVQGKTWREVTQDRHVNPSWVGRECIMPWEAKVYVTE